MTKKILTLVTLVLVVVAGFLFRANLRSLYSKISGQLPGFQTVVENVLNNKEILLPGPLKSSQDSSSAFLTRGGVIKWTNAQRHSKGLPPLLENLKLDSSASKKVQDMFAKQYFEHVSPSGVSVSNLADVVGYSFLSIGENLALGNFKNDEALVQAWMDSPGHRANILNTKFRDIGVAVMKGQYQGRTIWLAVQHFGLSDSVCPSADKTLKVAIDSREVQLVQMKQQLDAMQADINNTEPKRGDAYNSKVDAYNALVKQYNVLLDEQKSWITRYNGEVNVFNACLQSYK